MRKMFLLCLVVCCQTFAFSQADVSKLFTQSPEAVIKFQIQERSQLETLTRMISIDNVIGNEVIAYTTREEFEQFLALNIPYEIIEKPVLAPEELNMLDFEAIQNNRNDWNYYPDYDAYVAMMQQFATDYPDICRLVEFGTSVQSRKLLSCVLSKNVHVREAEPQIFWTSTMHGDETTGYVLMLRYIDYLLNNYGTSDRITHLLDNMEIWINPLANPDGTYWGGNGSVLGARRNNANNKDLNRNYYDDVYNGNVPPGYGPLQPETELFMTLQQEQSFNLACNLHGGAEVCNYPWDNKTAFAADNSWWVSVCREYADTVHTYSPSSYMDDENNGIVRGCEWYIISGGRQDYANYYDHTREFCLEISNTKTPPTSQLPNLWNYNYRSFLNYTQQALYGIHGTVTDACSGEPVYAKIFVNSHDVDESFVMTDPRVGFYARPIKGGTYSITYSADGYTSQTETITIADRQQIIQNIELPPVNSSTVPPVTEFTADKTLLTEGEATTVQFSDLSANCPNQWQWYFEGGTPETSVEQHPVITYNAKKLIETKYLDVKLVTENDYGKDSILKEAYIKIGLPPISGFNADPTTISANHSVSFFDMTENSPDSWNWIFEGGAPEICTEQNPVIVYKHPGTYAVTLATGNIFGTHSITKEHYITVTETISPVADFIADLMHIATGGSIRFTDLSENAANWEWHFEGGTPETSSEQNPTVLYENPGSFDVTLTVTNADGSDEMLKENYITADNVAVDEQEFLPVKIFPNPVSQGATVTIDADSPLRKIEWINMSGAIVKTIYTDAVSYTFSIPGIEQGIYLIKIETVKGISVKKIQVQ